MLDAIDEIVELFTALADVAGAAFKLAIALAGLALLEAAPWG